MSASDPEDDSRDPRYARTSARSPMSAFRIPSGRANGKSTEIPPQLTAAVPTWVWRTVQRAPTRSLLVIGLFDAALLGLRPWLPMPAVGLLDIAAHVLTTAILLATVAPVRSRTFVLSALWASILIDVDHAPPFLHLLTVPFHTERPITHCLLVAVLPLFLVRLRPAWSRALLTGVSCGILTHLLRDAATGSIPLLWPLPIAPLRLPYPAYALALLACASILRWRFRRVRRTADSRPGFTVQLVGPAE